MATSITCNLVSSDDFQANANEFYDQKTPDVLGLSNGVGGAAAVQFAVIDNLAALTNTDFVVV